MQEIMEIPEFRNYERLSLVGRKFEKDELDYVMEFGREDQKLRIIKGQIPEDYYHPNVSFTIVNSFIAARCTKYELAKNDNDFQKNSGAETHVRQGIVGGA